MGEYFKPWRRKAGCMALLLACVFAIGWLRSQLLCDGYFNFGEERNQSILSAAGTLVWRWSPHQPTDDPSDHHRWHSSLGVSKGIDRSKYRFRWCGFTIREYIASWGNGQHITEFAIPYYCVTIPLAVLSGVLFSKPRPSAPTKITEPTPVNGT
jgi:hypothetical protein